jgi:toxin-antitoxin system PIN domain toxin
MIAVDTNILVHCHREESEWHARAISAIKSLAEGSMPWAIPWQCLHEFLAIVTHPRIFKPPTPMANALAAVSAWTESPSCTLLAEGPEHGVFLHDTLKASQVTGAKVHDARIAALCQQHGINELWSADRDFSRFPELVVVNPLLGG